MNNQSALDRLKEIEAERLELQQTIRLEKANTSFPIFTRKGNVLSKQFSSGKAIDVKIDGNYIYVQSYDWAGGVTTTAWADYITGKTDPITPEEFEAARTEVIQKLSAL
jgi:hypothetical protein